VAKHDLDAIKSARSIESKEQVTETGIWYHAKLHEFQGYVVLSAKTKYLVSAVTYRFLINDPDPDYLIDSLLNHIEEFRSRKMK
jgi:hypothetical protein